MIVVWGITVSKSMFALLGLKCIIIIYRLGTLNAIMSVKRASGSSPTPPRKVRKLSGYNCWHRQFLQSPGNLSFRCSMDLISLFSMKNYMSLWANEYIHFIQCHVEAKMLSSLSEKNKVSGSKWRALSANERQQFNEMANSKQVTATTNKKKEMRRALSSLTNMVNGQFSYK